MAKSCRPCAARTLIYPPPSPHISHRGAARSGLRVQLVVSPKAQGAPTHPGHSLDAGRGRVWACLRPSSTFTEPARGIYRYARDASLISTLYAHWGFTASDAECAHVFVADVSTAATRSPAIPVHVKAFYEPSAAHKA